MPISQIITDLPTPPSSGDATNFRTRADAFMGSLDNFASELNTFSTQANTLETNVNAKEASATNSAFVASSAANFQGTWTNQTTQVGQSWYYNGKIYIALIAGNTSPTASPSNWFDLTNYVSLAGNQTIVGVKTFNATPQILTAPPAGEASYGVPNTYWVKEKGVEYRTVVAVTDNISLSSAHFGANLFLYSAVAKTVTLPLVAQCPIGVTYTLTNNNTGTWYINRSGTNTIFLGETSQISIALTAGSTITLVSRGDYWVVAGGNNNTLGYGQVWQDVTTSRASGVTYTNSTGRPIEVAIRVHNDYKATVSGILIAEGNEGLASAITSCSFIVPNNTTYSITNAYSVLSWSELR